MVPKKTVFIVDDDEASLASLEALMKSEGLDAASYTSAEGFLKAYDGRSDACLVLDMRLGGMSGLELQQALISCGAPLPIIMITGHADEGNRNDAKSNGAIAVLEKPFCASELCKLVHGVLTRAGDG